MSKIQSFMSTNFFVKTNKLENNNLSVFTAQAHPNVIFSSTGLSCLNLSTNKQIQNLNICTNNNESNKICYKSENISMCLKSVKRSPSIFNKPSITKSNKSKIINSVENRVLPLKIKYISFKKRSQLLSSKIKMNKKLEIVNNGNNQTNVTKTLSVLETLLNN